jgi:hypothetical protein
MSNIILYIAHIGQFVAARKHGRYLKENNARVELHMARTTESIFTFLFVILWWYPFESAYQQISKDKNYTEK